METMAVPSEDSRGWFEKAGAQVTDNVKKLKNFAATRNLELIGVTFGGAVSAVLPGTGILAALGMGSALYGIKYRDSIKSVSDLKHVLRVGLLNTSSLALGVSVIGIAFVAASGCMSAPHHITFIGPNATLDSTAQFQGNGNIVIGPEVAVGPHAIINADLDDKITIGPNVVIGSDVVISRSANIKDSIICSGTNIYSPYGTNISDSYIGNNSHISGAGGYVPIDIEHSVLGNNTQVDIEVKLKNVYVGDNVHIHGWSSLSDGTVTSGAEVPSGMNARNFLITAPAAVP